MTDDEKAALSQEMCRAIAPILAGKPPEVQSACLADLAAMYVAGFLPAGIRDGVLDMHVALIRQLVPINAAQIHGRRT